VLAEGSEFTGASVFLSVYKRRTASDGGLSLQDGKLLARYGISGLGDLVGRAAADQRFKLGTAVKAVFAVDDTPLSLQGLPSLLFALAGVGSESLTLVSLQDTTRLERLVRLLHPHQHHPVVRLCQVPSCQRRDNKATRCSSWYKVYEDEWMIVHAQSCFRCDTAKVIYLYTFHNLFVLGGTPQKNTLLVLPPGVSPSDLHQSCWGPQTLPVVTVTDDEEKAVFDVPVRLLAGIALSPAPECNSNGSSHDTKDEMSPFDWHFVGETSSDNNNGTTMETLVRIDPGLLVRAQRQANLETPITSTSRTCSRHLLTGTSLLFDLSAGGARKPIVVDRNRLREIESAAVRKAHSTKAEKDIAAERTSREMFLTLPLATEPFSNVQDENEICLDEESVCSENNCGSSGKKVCQLLVLGTGCASPSPHRGASGYALLLPSSDEEESVVAVEAGEGFSTQWNRFAGGRRFSTIKAIWISHAHWDHYGGLANLLVCIYNEKLEAKRPAGKMGKHDESSGVSGDRAGKRRRTSNETPWVLAPRKVLDYLRLIFDDPSVYFRASIHENHGGMSLLFPHCPRDEALSKNFLFWENVRVDHSCAQAYGFVAGLRRQGQREAGAPPFIFCFSGDTRPSLELVRACQHLSVRHGLSGVNFLLHEATFDESEKQMSLLKKHSTFQEALQVGRDVSAKRLLLTHFSQRYERIREVVSKGSEQMQVCSAVDGMLCPLYEA
jgi:ribonuclease BN (tRNA processing enzyme)